MLRMTSPGCPQGDRPETAPLSTRQGNCKLMLGVAHCIVISTSPKVAKNEHSVASCIKSIQQLAAKVKLLRGITEKKCSEKSVLELQVFLNWSGNIMRTL